MRLRAGASAGARINVLGVGVDAIDIPRALDEIRARIECGDRTYITVTGAHGIIECQSDPDLRDIHNRAGLVVPDGMPLVWLGRLAGHRQMRRVYGPDLMLSVCDPSAGPYRHFLYGGAPGIPERLADRLRDRFPGIEIVGSYSPPFRPLRAAEDDEVVATIDRSGADIVWVGLSTPKQERWMAAHLGRLRAPVMIGVGAAFDFHAGVKRQAPRWMQGAGLEWAFRAATEPRRLGRRYATVVPRFLALSAAQHLGLRRFPTP